AHVVSARRGGRWFVFAHLWDPVDDGPVRADGPCAFVASGTSSNVRIAVCDPTCSQERLTIRAAMPRNYSRLTWRNARLRLNTGSDITIDARVSDAGGASLEARLDR